MDNCYNRKNRRKYSLKVHIVLVTKYRKQILNGSISDDVKQKIYDICKAYNHEIITMETDKDHIHFLLCYDTTDRVCDIIKEIEQQICGRNIQTFFLNAIGRKRFFGLTDISHVVSEKCLPLPYKSTLKLRDSGKQFTVLLPPPKGSGFPHTTTERILIMNKTQLIKEVANRIEGMTQKDVLVVLDTFQDVIKETVVNGDKVSIGGFMNFEKNHVPAKSGVTKLGGAKKPWSTPEKDEVKVKLSKLYKIIE